MFHTCPYCICICFKKALHHSFVCIWFCLEMICKKLPKHNMHSERNHFEGWRHPAKETMSETVVECGSNSVDLYVVCFVTIGRPANKCPKFQRSIFAANIEPVEVTCVFGFFVRLMCRCFGPPGHRTALSRQWSVAWKELRMKSWIIWTRNEKSVCCWCSPFLRVSSDHNTFSLYLQNG